MTNLMPEFCPHCLADFAAELVEIKTTNPPKCGRCLLPLWMEDRSGRTPDRPWPSYERLKDAGSEGWKAKYIDLLKEYHQIVEDLERMVRNLKEVAK